MTGNRRRLLIVAFGESQQIGEIPAKKFRTNRIIYCSVPTRLTYPNLILAATVDLAKSAPSRATEHHKFEP